MGRRSGREIFKIELIIMMAGQSRELNLGLGIAGFLLIALTSPAQIPNEGVPVNTEIVLKIGAADISSYAIDKNLSRFKHTTSNSGRPSDTSIRAWLELYLARQVIIAEALNEGFDRQPRVLGTVETMENYQLAQLAEAGAAPTESEMRLAYEALPASADGQKPPFEKVRLWLQQRLTQQHREANHHSWYLQAVAPAKLTLNPTVAQDLVQRLRVKLGPQSEIGEELVGELSTKPLATYRRDGTDVTLTVEQWRQHWNAQFIHVPPTSMEQLQSSIEDWLIADAEAAAARQSGRDREARFIEDRRNFLYYQALDLFEKSVLTTRIEITPVELETYYREHSAEFARPTKAHGKLLRFPDEVTGSKWLRSRTPSELDLASEITVSAQEPFSAAPGATDVILRTADGQTFGPITTPTGTVIFLKERTETERIAFAEVENRSGTILSRPKLDALELRLAREWSPRFTIRDHFHSEAFGVAGSVQKPWAAVVGAGQK